MYYRMKLSDKVRVPPHRLGEALDKVILDVLQEQLEGSIDKEIGIFIGVTKVLTIGEGEIIPGDGAVFYDVVFEAYGPPVITPGGHGGTCCRDHQFRGICKPRTYRCDAPCQPDIRRIYQFRREELTTDLPGIKEIYCGRRTHPQPPGNTQPQ